MTAPTVLLTRAQAQAEATAVRLAARGHVALVAPLVKIEAVIEPPPGVNAPVQAILLTSPNGAAALARHRPDRATRVLAVGERTAGALREAGFGDVRSAEGDAAALAALALTTLFPDAGPVLHARGETVGRSPLDPLAEAGFETQEVILYRTVPLDGFEPDVVPLLRSIRTAPVYSPGSARRLHTALDALPPGVVPRLAILGISEATLAPFAGTGHDLHVASHPSEDALLDLLEEVSQKPVAPPGIRR